MKIIRDTLFLLMWKNMLSILWIYHKNTHLYLFLKTLFHHWFRSPSIVTHFPRQELGKVGVWFGKQVFLCRHCNMPEPLHYHVYSLILFTEWIECDLKVIVLHYMLVNLNSVCHFSSKISFVFYSKDLIQQNLASAVCYNTVKALTALLRIGQML